MASVLLEAAAGLVTMATGFVAAALTTGVAVKACAEGVATTLVATAADGATTATAAGLCIMPIIGRGTKNPSAVAHPALAREHIVFVRTAVGLKFFTETRSVFTPGRTHRAAPPERVSGSGYGAPAHQLCGPLPSVCRFSVTAHQPTSAPPRSLYG